MERILDEEAGLACSNGARNVSTAGAAWRTIGIAIEPVVVVPRAGETVPRSEGGAMFSGGDAAKPVLPIGVAKKRFIWGTRPKDDEDEDDDADSEINSEDSRPLLRFFPRSLLMSASDSMLSSNRVGELRWLRT